MKSSPKWGRNSKAICTTCCSEIAITLQKILHTGYAMPKSPIGCVQPIQCFRDIADSRSAVCLLTSDFGRYARKGSQSFSSVLLTSTYIRLEAFSLIDTESLHIHDLHMNMGWDLTWVNWTTLQVNRLAGIAVCLHCLLPPTWVPPLSTYSLSPVLPGGAGKHLTNFKELLWPTELCQVLGMPSFSSTPSD